MVIAPEEEMLRVVLHALRQRAEAVAEAPAEPVKETRKTAKASAPEVSVDHEEEVKPAVSDKTKEKVKAQENEKPKAKAKAAK